MKLKDAYRGATVRAWAALGWTAAAAGIGAALLMVSPADAQTFDCASLDPSLHPPPAKPYFMLVVDTSGSMLSCTNPQPIEDPGDNDDLCLGAGELFCFPKSCPTVLNNTNFNSCNMEPTRLNDAKCALRQTVQAFAGEVNFGMATFPTTLSNCPGGACADSCTTADGSCNPPNALNTEGEFYGCTATALPNARSGGCTTPGICQTCGNNPDCAAATPPIMANNWDNGGAVVVPLLQDPLTGPPPAPNTTELLKWFDGSCNEDKELFALGFTPLGGALTSVREYLSFGWSSGWGDGTYCATGGPPVIGTPIDAANDRPCRSINIILVTDGEETCGGSAALVAAELFNQGVAIAGETVPIRTHVIGFAGVDAADVDPIAAAGGTGTALTASNEVELSLALSQIISGAIHPEVCNNVDDNCNGCVDEGYQQLCNTRPTCCSWTTTNPVTTSSGDLDCSSASLGQREVCICNYLNSIDAANPNGDVSLLPCTSPAQAADPTRTLGLCYNPGEICDNVDNNCDGTVDESQLKCLQGNPPVLTCAAPNDPCDNDDNNCDGVIDNLPGSAVPKSSCPCGQNTRPETCNGCDDDCNGIIDDSAPPVFCGELDPPWCAGTQACIAVPNVTPGSCQTLQLQACNNDTTRAEVCNGIDDDCDGIIDDTPVDAGGTCTTPPGAPVAGECEAGTLRCVNGALQCQGYVGPNPEICDGLDNDCNGIIDDNPSDVGEQCGTDVGECTFGTTICVGGQPVCNGGVQKAPEVCNNLDDDCDGLVDEPLLNDRPTVNGCWNDPDGTGSCSHGGLFWDPPPGATCNGAGSLTSPCRAGTLVCQTGAWVCLGDTGPEPEECDGRDEDCDGVADDGVPAAGAVCGTPPQIAQVGICTPGSLLCISGQEQCSGGQGPQPEICNGLDDNCDGVVDNNVPGVGLNCGTDTGECSPGTTVCGQDPVSGNITIFCQGGNGPDPEICNGLDDNCDGVVDNSLTDRPANPGCWNVSGTTCTFGGLTWSPPPGGTCDGLGSLFSPCVPGQLACVSGGWVCQGGRLPDPGEVCDGIDNDCDGVPDDGNPGGGGTCTPNPTDPVVGECDPGTLNCINGALVCQGYVGPRPELCDNLDNNCNTLIDDGVPGVGNQCGSSTGICQPGTTACVAGVLQCQNAIGGQDEACNGLDDDCDGFTDEEPMFTAPVGGQALPSNRACWPLPGSTCTFVNATWDPPAGANCTDLGTLTTPCSPGQLRCNGVDQWACVGGELPAQETCNGGDDDCDGTPDDGDPGGGGACGIDTGECTVGTEHCVNGILECNGVPPSNESCDGLDNDCDGTIDNGIALGERCDPPYDVTDYPGPRIFSDCQVSQSTSCCKGFLECDPSNPTVPRCGGGVPPAPEICDGLDNDCDGVVDEVGPAPDGVEGSADPLDANCTPDPTHPDCQNIGEDCGSNVGQCTYGKWACVNGEFVCRGGTPAQPQETCDCTDNDCDGQTDEEVVDCAASEDCVNFNGICQCAEPCPNDEFGCPVTTRTECEDVTLSNEGTAGRYCVLDPCGDCSLETVTNTAGDVVCAPGGPSIDGTRVPECVCKGLDGCRSPCFGVRCEPGFKCAAVGDSAGCQPDGSCTFFGCPDGEACNADTCVDDPCDPFPTDCNPDQGCRPNATFDGHECFASCADVSCGATEHCIDGSCQATGCGAACPSGELCVEPSDAGTEQCCDPMTTACGNDPCAGVQCPSGQFCDSFGQCVNPPEPPMGGTGGAGGAGGGAGGAGTGARDGGAAAAGPDGSAAAGGTGGTTRRPNEVFGLATGGGGCACETVRGSPPTPGALALAGLLLGALGLRRRARNGGVR